jgi:hypothetical protein
MSARVAQGVPQPQGVDDDPLTYYQRLFCKFLQLLFKTFEKGGYHWEQDDKNSDIIISADSPIAKETVEKRPAILITRGPVSFSNISLDQFAGPILNWADGSVAPSDFIPNKNPSTGAKRHTDLSAGTAVYNVISKEDVEAQRLAYFAAKMTRMLKKALLRAGLHRVGEEISIGSVSPPGALVQPDSNEVKMVSVSVPYYYQETWTITPTNKTLLNGISLALRSEVEAPAPGATIVKGPSIYGQPIQYSKLLEIDQKVLVTGKSPKPFLK